jgi:hypothetical protein
MLRLHPQEVQDNTTFVESFLLLVEKIYAAADMAIFLETIETVIIQRVKSNHT